MPRGDVLIIALCVGMALTGVLMVAWVDRLETKHDCVIIAQGVKR